MLLRTTDIPWESVPRSALRSEQRATALAQLAVALFLCPNRVGMFHRCPVNSRSWRSFGFALRTADKMTGRSGDDMARQTGFRH